jgi:hypothetical protein
MVVCSENALKSPDLEDDGQIIFVDMDGQRGTISYDIVPYSLNHQNALQCKRKQINHRWAIGVVELLVIMVIIMNFGTKMMISSLK